LEAVFRELDGVTVVDLSGSIKTNEDYDTFKKLINDVVSHGKLNVLLNFRNVSFINSSGLGHLILAAKRISEDRGNLKIAELSSDMRELFTFTRLDTKIPVFESEEEALKSF